jgi:hypothetical protein
MQASNVAVCLQLLFSGKSNNGSCEIGVSHDSEDVSVGSLGCNTKWMCR